MTAALQTHKQPALALMQSALRERGQLEAEYPLVFGDASSGDIIGLEEGDSLVSSCAILRRELMFEGQTLSVGLIGSVATAPEFRGRGFARKVLDEACSVLAKKGATIAWLWANDAEVYASMGWRPSGAELLYLVHPEQRTFLPNPKGVRPYGESDLDSVYALYQEHDCRVRRSRDEMRALLGVPGMTVLVQEENGRVIGYACVGRGEDLTQVMHEWGGGCPSVLALLHGHLDIADDEEDGSLYMMVPPGEKSIVDYFHITQTKGAIGFLGLAKIIHREGAASILKAQLPTDVLVEVTPTLVILRRGKNRISLNDDDLLAALLAPKGDRAWAKKIEHRLRIETTDLPLLPFMWGLDSI